MNNLSSVPEITAGPLLSTISKYSFSVCSQASCELQFQGMVLSSLAFICRMRMAFMHITPFFSPRSLSFTEKWSGKYSAKDGPIRIITIHWSPLSVLGFTLHVVLFCVPTQVWRTTCPVPTGSHRRVSLPTGPLCSDSTAPGPQQALATAGFSTVSLVSSSLEGRRGGITECPTFSGSLLPLSGLHLRFLHVFLRLDSSLLLNCWITFHWVQGQSYWRPPWLLPRFGNWEESSYSRLCPGLCVDIGFNSFGYKYL